MTRAKARVTWTEGNEARVRPLPSVSRYMDIARFAEDGPEWPDGAWTVVLEFPVPPSVQGNPSHGTVHFLMEDAPNEILRPGNAFELYRGLTRVATVEVLPN